MGISLRILMASLLGLVACGPTAPDDEGTPDQAAEDDAGPDPTIEQRCRDSAELSRRAAELGCECLVAAGEEADLASCVATRATPQSAIDCICPIYARHPESEALLDCLIPVQKAATDCTAEALCNEAKREACNEQFAAYMLCPVPQAAADEALDACEMP